MRHSHERKALLHDIIQRKLRDGIFQQRQVALKVIKLSASYFRTALKIHPAAANSIVQMILGARFTLAVNLYLNQVFLAAKRYVVKGDVRHVFQDCGYFFLGGF